MRKALPILALLLLAPALSGCTTVQEALARAASVMAKVRTTLVEVRGGISEGCRALGIAEQQPASQACAQKVSRLRAGVAAICQNQDKLTDNVVGNYYSSVKNAVKQAQAACQ